MHDVKLSAKRKKKKKKKVAQTKGGGDDAMIVICFCKNIKKKMNKKRERLACRGWTDLHDL